jgi:predicted sulfurtransferase
MCVSSIVPSPIYPLYASVLVMFVLQVVIDVRNMYEIRIGKFKGAVDPCTNSFREFTSWVDYQFQLAEPSTQKSEGNNDNGADRSAEDLNATKQLPRVAMYCTGGVRCEKASSFLLSKGFKEVNQKP